MPDTSVSVNTNENHRKVGIIAVAVAAVVVVALIIVLFGGRSYTDTVDKYITAQFDADAKALFELVPQEVLNYALEESGYDKDEFNELVEDASDSLKDQLDYIEAYLGKDWSVSYEIASIEDVTGDDFADVKYNYKDIDIKVSAAKTVKIELTIKAGEKERNTSMTVSLIKVGNSWYLDVTSMPMIF